MTIKDKLTERINELEAMKAGLLRKEQFLDPTNDTFLYSTESISDIAGTQGSTPKNLSTILEVIVKEINTYVEYIRDLPFAESHVIYRERTDVDLALVSNNRASFNIPMSWTKRGDGYDFNSVQSQVALSKFFGSVKKMTVTSSPSFRKHGENGEDINFEIKMIKLNPRKNESSVFRSGSGPLSVVLDENSISGDDIIFIGIVPSVDLDPAAIYFKDFTYRIAIERHDGTEDVIVNSIANTRVGNSSINSDTTAGIMVNWDMLTFNRLDIKYLNTIGNSGQFATDFDGFLGGGLTAGNVLSSISVEQFSSDLQEMAISYREGVAWFRKLLDDTYGFYDMNSTNVESIVFNNLRPISHVLEEAIDAL